MPKPLCRSPTTQRSAHRVPHFVDRLLPRVDLDLVGHALRRTPNEDAADDRLVERRRQRCPVGGELEAIAADTFSGLDGTRPLVGLVVDHDQPVVTPIQEVDVALERGGAEGNGDVQLPPPGALRRLPHRAQRSPHGERHDRRLVADDPLRRRLGGRRSLESLARRQIDDLEHAVDRPTDGRAVAAAVPGGQVEVAGVLGETRIGRLGRLRSQRGRGEPLVGRAPPANAASRWAAQLARSSGGVGCGGRGGRGGTGTASASRKRTGVPSAARRRARPPSAAPGRRRAACARRGAPTPRGGRAPGWPPRTAGAVARGTPSARRSAGSARRPAWRWPRRAGYRSRPRAGTRPGFPAPRAASARGHPGHDRDRELEPLRSMDRHDPHGVVIGLGQHGLDHPRPLPRLPVGPFQEVPQGSSLGVVVGAGLVGHEAQPPPQVAGARPRTRARAGDGRGPRSISSDGVTHSRSRCRSPSQRSPAITGSVGSSVGGSSP